VCTALGFHLDRRVYRGVSSGGQYKIYLKKREMIDMPDSKFVQESRKQWSSEPAFIFSMTAAAVGLGNLWRFPYILGAALLCWFIPVENLRGPWG